MNIESHVIEIYTDGSGDPISRLGCWAAILFIGREKIILEGSAEETTHQRMELLAIIESLDHVQANTIEGVINVYTDSQYAMGLIERSVELKKLKFRTLNNKEFRNEELMRAFLERAERPGVSFFKLKAHQKVKEGNYNREVDLLVRKSLRQLVNSQTPDSSAAGQQDAPL